MSGDTPSTFTAAILFMRFRIQVNLSTSHESGSELIIIWKQILVVVLLSLAWIVLSATCYKLSYDFSLFFLSLLQCYLFRVVKNSPNVR